MLHARWPSTFQLCSSISNSMGNMSDPLSSSSNHTGPNSVAKILCTIFWWLTRRWRQNHPLNQIQNLRLARKSPLPLYLCYHQWCWSLYCCLSLPIPSCTQRRPHPWRDNTSASLWAKHKVCRVVFSNYPDLKIEWVAKLTSRCLMRRQKTRLASKFFSFFLIISKVINNQ